MRNLKWILSVLLLLISAGPVVRGQSQPLVGFVLTNTLNTASLSDPGPDGLTLLAQAFARQGARPTVLRLDGPIPDDMEVVVLVGPSRSLTTAHLAYLWDYLARGHNLLLAFDPNGYQGVNSERATGGLNRLLQLEFGTGVEDNLLVQSWFLKAGLDDLRANQIITQADAFVPHPVLEPLVSYQVSVHIWGGRTVLAEPFGPGPSYAYPLSYVETAFGETSTRLFAAEEADPLQVNIGTDPQGRLLIGALGENEQLNARVAVLGDSELLQNGFGLARLPGTQTPRYPGNQMLVDRLVSWLLERPETDWPGLPRGFTWLQIDGDSADWDLSLPAFDDMVTEDEPSRYDLQRVFAIRNDAYSYLLIETDQPPPPTVEVWIEAVNNGRPVRLRLSQSAITIDDSPPVYEDSAIGVGTSIEVRLPLRVVGLSPSFEQLCLVNPQDTTQQDCLDRTFTTRLVSEVDPRPLHNLSGPLAVVNATGTVNLRSAPDPNAGVVGSVNNGTLFIVIERDATGDWLRVVNSRFEGWMNASLIAANIDPNSITGPDIITPDESDSAPAGTATPVPEVECMIGVTGEVNRRAAPDTTAEVLGLLTPEEDLPADGQAPAGGDLVWWRLGDQGWVRSDVVIEIGDCDLLPVVEP